MLAGLLGPALGVAQTVFAGLFSPAYPLRYNFFLK